MESIGYKVVSKINSKSFGPATYLALQSVRYRIGKTTTHDPEKAGPMAVFDSKENAIQFISAIYADCVTSETLYILKVSYVESNLRALWKHIGRYISEYHLLQLPPGTFLAESVTPLEELPGSYEVSNNK